MKVKETPIVFDCEGVPLIGVVHVPERPLAAGILTVAAGGIQYRAGCGRQLVSLARTLAAEGTPVMRFDHRGHGDSAGELLGFQHMDLDLQRAIEVFQENVPGLKDIVLYGGCEAASGIMISASKLANVKSMILANPWVDSDSMQALVSRQHYSRRLRDPQFWKKLVTFKYNLLRYASGFVSYAKKKILMLASPGKDYVKQVPVSGVSFQERMLDGFQKFDGPVLFLKSGLSFVSEEFDQLVGSSSVWRQAYSRASVKRVVLPSADQTFSTSASRDGLGTAVADWLVEISKLHD